MIRARMPRLSIGGNIYVEAGEDRLILTNDDARFADLME